MDNCIFCKISEKREPADIVYQDQTFCAFLHPTPINHGHIILTTNEHYTSLTLLDDETYSKLQCLARKLAVATLKTKNYDGFNIQHNHGECAGQDSLHAALHIIPRVGTDGFHLNWRMQKPADEEQRNELIDFIKSKLL